MEMTEWSLHCRKAEVLIQGVFMYEKLDVGFISYDDKMLPFPEVTEEEFTSSY